MAEEDLNTGVIREFRENEGRVGGRFTGAPMLLLHHTGARSGKAQVSPMMYLRDEARYLVFASNAGADRNPAWYHNLRANPETRIEVGTETVPVRASELPRAERDRFYAKQAELYPGFADYQAGTERIIPVLALTPVG